MIKSTEKRKIKIPVKRKKVRWGIAGCGKFTEQAILPALNEIKRNKVISVYSHTLERAQTIANKFIIPNATNNYDEFVRGEFDVVYIGSRNIDHFEQVIKAAEAGKHIHCEKPLSMTSEEAEEMVRVCNKNNVFLSVNFVHRFHPLVIKAKEFIDKEMLGKLVSISTSFNANFPPDDNFRFKKKLSGGGALRDLGSHMIDLLRFFGGEIIEIKGNVDNVVYNSEVDDFANAIVKFEKSGYGFFNVSFNTKKPFNRIEILGYRGSLTIENLIGKKSSSTRLIINLDGEAKKSFRRRANKLNYTLRSVQNSLMKNEMPKVTGYDGLVNMQLIENLERQCGRNLT